MPYCPAFLFILKTIYDEKKEMRRPWSLRKWACTAGSAMWFNPKVITARNRWETSSTVRFICFMPYARSSAPTSRALPVSLQSGPAGASPSSALRTTRCSSFWTGKLSGKQGSYADRKCTTNFDPYSDSNPLIISGLSEIIVVKFVVHPVPHFLWTISG